MDASRVSAAGFHEQTLSASRAVQQSRRSHQKVKQVRWME